ncbi:MAG TPA: hypothetical protein VN622_05935 [Clostridia bacterium]|nr:hypothetical protein [Clostridia bacterium]
MGKAAKKEAPKRVPFDWAKLKKMAENGASIAEMASKTDRNYDPNSEDPCKPTRARLCIAANKGVRIDGRLICFKRSSSLQAKKATESKASLKKVTKATAKKSKPKTIPKPSVVPKPEAPKTQPEA